jgi:hypothetical protein
MTLPAEPPRSIDTALKTGDSGWAVFGLQKCLNFVNGSTLVADGAFGTVTEGAVASYQKRMSLLADGIAGPKTQLAACQHLCAVTFINGAPNGLGLGMVEGEGGYYFGAVNWGVTGGVDCGVVQERVVGPPFSSVNLRHAFNAPESLKGALITVTERAKGYAVHSWAKFSWERQLRCAIMAHNWPVAALSIAKTGKCPHPDSTDGWWPRTLEFPDGTLVRTRWDWCQWYAMGGPHGEARIPRYVTRWS